MMNSSYDTFISYFSELIDNKYIFSLLSIFIVVISFSYIRGKAKSGFSISNKLFIFLIGYKKKNKNDLIDDIIDIEKFNFHYNTNAISKRQIARFEEWIRKYELDFRLISKLKKHLDIESLKVKKINKIYFRCVFISIFIPVIIIFQTSIIALKPALLVKMETTGWFWINNESATEFSFFDTNNKPWVINEKICKDEKNITEKSNNKNSSVAFIDRTIFNLICNSFTNETDIKYISKNTRQQQIFFQFVSATLLIFTFLLFKHLMSLTITYDSRNMIRLKLKRFRACKYK